MRLDRAPASLPPSALRCPPAAISAPPLAFAPASAGRPRAAIVRALATVRASECASRSEQPIAGPRCARASECARARPIGRNGIYYPRNATELLAMHVTQASAVGAAEIVM